jgi:hypothetical protein
MYLTDTDIDENNIKIYLTKCILQRSVRRAQTGFKGFKTRGRIKRQRLRTFWFPEMLEYLD